MARMAEQRPEEEKRNVGGMGCGSMGLDEGIVDEEVWKRNLVEQLVGIREGGEILKSKHFDKPACRKGV